ncbi:MAG: nicotinate (nicotinamide) nucleotide adenylyltransferase [Acidobacteria bacterium]|nr:nicotinate (nicotinamide) nucleotide adenylyltransferase [Acidobacteriota bacterium]
MFGGSFDPVHLGHLVPAVRALETFRFDALYFVPAGRPPHRSRALAPFAHRFAMLVLATAPHDRLFVSDVELDGDGPTYTVETLQRFRRSTAADDLYFLLGSDSLAQIATWHRWQELVELAHLVVLHRDTVWSDELVAAVPAALRTRLRTVTPSASVPEPPPGQRGIYLLDHEPLPISATGLRERLRAGTAIDELVPPEVGRYIAKYRLYRQGGEERHA